MSSIVEVEEVFNVKPAVVWKAITELNQMKQWFFENIPAFEPLVGFQTEFNVKATERDFYHLWEITEVVLGEKITYSWKYNELIGESFATFKVSEQGDRTKLKVTCIGLDSFPKDIPEFKYESCLAGWNYFIKDRLKKYLNNLK